MVYICGVFGKGHITLAGQGRLWVDRGASLSGRTKKEDGQSGQPKEVLRTEDRLALTGSANVHTPAKLG